MCTYVIILLQGQGKEVRCMNINSAGLIEKLSKDIAFLESLLYLRTVVSNDERLEESQEVQFLLSSFERFVNDKR